MKQKNHFRPIKGTKFSTKSGNYISQGIWSNEMLDYANTVTGKKYTSSIEDFNNAVDDGKIIIEL